MIDRRKVADEADMIVNGYAFAKCVEGYRVLNSFWQPFQFQNSGGTDRSLRCKRTVYRDRRRHGGDAAASGRSAFLRAVHAGGAVAGPGSIDWGMDQY